MRFFLIILALTTFEAFAQSTDLCDYVDIPNCKNIARQVRRTSSASFPSSGTATNVNPANMNFSRGLGVEFFGYGASKTAVNMVTGTGKIGAAVVNNNLENSFFGSRTPEGDVKFVHRTKHSDLYANRKTAAALGARIFQRNDVGLDVGAIFKRHSQLGHINPGVGVSMRWRFLNFGTSIYQDDILLKQQDFPNQIFTSPTYTERFLVRSYSFGLRIKNLALDYAVIQDRIKFYGEPTSIGIASAAFHWGNWLFNYAQRSEKSAANVVDQDVAIAQRYKSAAFYSVQYAFGKNIILGVAHNYFLLKETALTFTFFI